MKIKKTNNSFDKVLLIEESQRLINESENKDIILEFKPSNEMDFKNKLIETKRAKIIWFYNDGRVIEDIWNARTLSNESNIRRNIYSNNNVRTRKDTGLYKIIFEIID